MVETQSDEGLDLEYSTNCEASLRFWEVSVISDGFAVEIKAALSP